MVAEHAVPLDGRQGRLVVHALEVGIPLRVVQPGDAIVVEVVAGVDDEPVVGWRSNDAQQ